MGTRQRLDILLCSVALLAPAAAANAQRYARLDLAGPFIDVGGDAERYARVLQIAGFTGLTSWSIQPFSPSQVRSLRPTQAHPWSSRFALDATPRAAQALRPSARAVGNTTFPFQVSGGPTWAGRGVTAEIQAGTSGSWRAIEYQIAPLAYATQNAAFPLAPNGLAGRGRFEDARFPGTIDSPQRFGDAPLARLEPGTSSLVLDSRGVVAGLTSAPQQWGPEIQYPLVLGPNAGGFPAVYFGTSKPLDLWLFRGHARLVYGQLTQSSWSPVESGDTRRLGAGLVAVAQPRGTPGLELGVSRFLHRPWSDLSFSALERPFSGVVSNSGLAVNRQNENQVASAFGRWALPRAKSEFFGEIYREDYPGGFRKGTGSLVEMPDDYVSFSLGFQHLITADSSHIRSLRAEIVNGESSHQERLERGFVIPLPPYVHSTELQGHTYNGLILGSPEAYGGSGWTFALDDYTPRGRRSLAFQRSLRLDWLSSDTSTVRPVHPDVMYSIRAEMVRFTGANQIAMTLIPTVDLNRNLVGHHDVANLTAAVTLRGWKW
jgi:hypothetical protein